MNFNRGEQVVHRNFGVGKVISIEGMNFTGNQPRLYYQVEFSKTTIWVPVGGQPTKGLRPLTPRNQLYRFRALLKSPPAKRNDDFYVRKNSLEKLIDQGTFQGLCEVVRDLNAWNWMKPLNSYENVLLKQARATLAKEWSVTSGLSVNEALAEIAGYLTKSSQSET
jgi:RNA polymerase-interacting CarD/CdnL/TRCF family regulator